MQLIRDLIEVGVNVTVSRKKRTFKRRPSQNSQRAGSARKLLHYVLIRATWPHLCFANNKRESPVSQKSSTLPRSMGYRRRFRAFAENSLQFAFGSSGFRLESIAHILTVERFRYNSFAAAQSLKRYLVWPHLENFLQEKTTVFCFRPQNILCVS